MSKAESNLGGPDAAATDDTAQLSINPKDLTNEELEYVIKTGKIPPKFLSKNTVS